MLGAPAERSAKQQLAGSAGDVVKNIQTFLDDMAFSVIEKRTAAECEAAFNEVLPRYMQLVVHLGRIVATVVPPSVMTRLAADSFSELESDIRESAVLSFGANLRDRAVFTVFTLRRTSDLLQTILDSGGAPDGLQKQDSDFCGQFLAHALRARFSVDCLRLSMKAAQPIYPEALGVLADGLRSAVNAYAWVRQAVDLRLPLDDTQAAPFTAFDADDQALLKEAGYDLADDGE